MQDVKMKLGGAVTYWQAGPTYRADVERALAVNDVSLDMIPEPPSPHSLLRAALSQLCKGTVKDKGTELAVQGHKVPKHDGYEVVQINRDHCENQYHTLYSAKIIRDTEMIESIGMSEVQLATLTSLYQWRKSIVSAGDVTQTLVNIMHKLEGVPLRAGGGVFWVPDDNVPLLRAVADSMAACTGLENQSILVYSLRTVIDEHAVRAVKDALTKEINRDAGSIIEDLQGSFKEATAASRLQRAKTLRGRVEAYELILGETLTSLRSVLALADQAVTTAFTTLEADSVGAIFAG